MAMGEEWFPRFQRVYIFILLVVMLVLPACAMEPPREESTAMPSYTPSASPSPTSLPPSATPTAISTPVPPSVRAAELESILAADLEPTATSSPGTEALFRGIGEVVVVPLKIEVGEQVLWAAFTVGARSYSPPQNHFVAIYTYLENDWRMLGRLELENPDFLDVGSLEQAELEPEHVWLQVQGGVGAHGGCFDLLSFDGSGLHGVLSNCASSSDAGKLRDLNGDGTLEVILNWSENYVFCYACGVRIPLFQVWRWDGTQLVEVKLTKLPQSASEQLRQWNDRGVNLAKAELWKDAQEAIHQAVDIDGHNPTVAWNAVLIDLTANERARMAAEGPYPLLSQIFYGDYAAAIDLFRVYEPREIFSLHTPLVVGTIAEDWEEALRDWVLLFTDKALDADPELGAAYFMRGWAIYLADAGDMDALDEVEKAVQLAPGEALFMRCLAYLQSDEGIFGGVAVP